MPFNHILAACAFFLGVLWTIASILDQWRILEIPVASPTQRIVVQECYRYSRNPMYIGYLFLIAGAELILSSVAIILLFLWFIPIY